jgi:CRP-like cAMP-binding protein
MTTLLAHRHSQAALAHKAPPAAVIARSLAGMATVGAELDRSGTVMNFARGKTLFEEGDRAGYVFKVASGALRSVRLLADGRRYVIKFLLPGDFFGFVPNAEYPYSVEAVGDATVVRYARQAFEGVLDRNPQASRTFFNAVCKELSAAQERLLVMGRKTAEERLASFLIAMAERGKPGQAVELPMNRGDIADYLGLTVETVSRLLTRFRQRGLIDLPDNHSVMLRDHEGLTDLSLGEAA